MGGAQMTRLSFLLATFAGVAALAFLATPMQADWYPGQSYKMHFPQLPDPYGWDVEISSTNPQHECADDWQCTWTHGWINDIHFWYSVAGDGGTQIDHIVVTIYANLADAGVPGAPLWSQQFDRGEFTVIDPYGTGLQGFADPQYPETWSSGLNDHQTYQQINITNIAHPFCQGGMTYWLGIYVWWDDWPQSPVGWKTSDDNYGSPAVFRDLETGNWQALIPANGTPERLDFAFVITPEPSTSLLLISGAGIMAAYLLRRRKLHV
jgi:hypothetical protein